jgi:MraZ protein
VGNSVDQAPVASRRGSAHFFRGSFEHSVDEKGRISIPAPFRQVIAQRGDSVLVITNFICDGARCIEAFPLSGWVAFEDKLVERSRFDPQLKQLENFYLARAVECAIDPSGRVTIPAHLRSYAGLEQTAVFTACLEGFRVWDKRVWELVFREAESALLDNPGLFLNVDR